MQTTQTSLPPPDAFVRAFCIELFPSRAPVLNAGKKCALGRARPHGRRGRMSPAGNLNGNSRVFPPLFRALPAAGRR
jgi:hypothetical protein